MRAPLMCASATALSLRLTKDVGERICSPECPDVGETTANGGRGRHLGGPEMRARTRGPPPLEVAIARRRPPLARTRDIGIHAQAHRAARVPPLEPRLREY